MKIEHNQKYHTISVYASGVLMLAIAFYWGLTNFDIVWSGFMGLIRPIKPILFGFVLAYLLNPIMMWIEGLLEKAAFYQKIPRKARRGLSVLLTYLITSAVLISFLVIILPQVASNAAALAGQLQNYVAAAERFVNDLVENIPEGLVPQDYIDQITRMIGDSIQNLFAWISAGLPLLFSIAWQFGSGLIAACVAVISSIYMLLAKETFIAQTRKLLCAFLPRARVRRLMGVTRTTHMMFGRFITGKIIDSIIIGVLCFIGLSVMRMPNVVLVSFIVGVTNVLPYFGPFIGAIPGFFLIAFVSPVQGLIFLVFILVLQQIDGNIIGPMILGDSTGLSAFWVVFAILLFGGVFGPVGMFIGVPTFGVFYALMKEAITERLKAKRLPTETKDYLHPIGVDEDKADPPD